MVKFHIFTVQIFFRFHLIVFAAEGPWGPQGEGGPLRDPSVPPPASPSLSVGPVRCSVEKLKISIVSRQRSARRC